MKRYDTQHIIWFWTLETAYTILHKVPSVIIVLKKEKEMIEGCTNARLQER